MAAEHRRWKTAKRLAVGMALWGVMVALFLFDFGGPGVPGGHHPAPRVTNVSVERFLTDAQSGKMNVLYAPRGESDIFGEVATNRYERLVVTSSVAVLESQRFAHLGVPVRWAVPRPVAIQRAVSADAADTRTALLLLAFFSGPPVLLAIFMAVFLFIDRRRSGGASALTPS